MACGGIARLKKLRIGDKVMSLMAVGHAPLKVPGLVGKRHGAELYMTYARPRFNPDRSRIAGGERDDFIIRQIAPAAKVLPPVPGVADGLVPDQPIVAPGPHGPVCGNRYRAQTAHRQTVFE